MTFYIPSIALQIAAFQIIVMEIVTELNTEWERI